MNIQLTQKQKTILAIVFLILTGLGFAYWRLYMPQQTKWAEAAAAVNQSRDSIKKLREEFHNDEPGRELEKLDQEITQWQLAYDQRKRQFVSKVEPLPAEFKGFEWLKRYEELKKKVYEKALSKGIAIPETLGFTDSVPPADQADLLNLQLHNMESIVNAILASEGITNVNALGPMPETASGHAKIKILPYTIEITTKIDGVRSFMNNIAKSTEYFSVSSLSITQSDNEQVVVSMTLNTVLVQD